MEKRIFSSNGWCIVVVHGLAASGYRRIDCVDLFLAVGTGEFALYSQLRVDTLLPRNTVLEEISTVTRTPLQAYNYCVQLLIVQLSPVALHDHLRHSIGSNGLGKAWFLSIHNHLFLHALYLEMPPCNTLSMTDTSNWLLGQVHILLDATAPVVDIEPSVAASEGLGTELEC